MFDSRGGDADVLTAPDGVALALLESLTPLLEESGGEFTDFDVLDVMAGWSRQAAHAGRRQPHQP